MSQYVTVYMLATLVFLQAGLLPVNVDSVYVKYLTKGEVSCYIILLFPNCRYLDMYAGL